MEILNLLKLKDVGAKGQGQSTIRSRLATWEICDDSVDFYRVWDTKAREDLKISGKESLGYYELK
jgi:hypothetical protein